jgi:hypothetical protein
MWYLKKKNDTACGCKTSGVALYRQVMFFLPFFLVLIFLGRNSSKNFQEILTKMTQLLGDKKVGDRGPGKKR